MSVIRLHILAIPHTITNQNFTHCAFTNKVYHFCDMMTKQGYQVYHYGIESSNTKATKNIDVLKLKEWGKLRHQSLKFLNPQLTDDEITKKLIDKKTFIGDIANIETPLYKTFNKRLIKKLKENYRSTETDIVCLPFGKAHLEAINSLNVVFCESGIGYNGSFCNYRIYESNAWLNFTNGIDNNNYPSHYNFVANNYYDMDEWTYNEPTTQIIGFFGRICNTKGITIFVEIAKKYPNIKFVICGQGDSSLYLLNDNIEYKEPICGKERNKFLGSLTAIICPSLFLEPWCNTSVEAQLCGTPVISTYHGAFSENIENYKTGLLCHTLSDYCVGIDKALSGYFDRKYISERAKRLYSIENIGKTYDYIFKSIMDIHNGNNGWYSENKHIEKLF